MALLYYTKVSGKPENIDLFPSSLEGWKSTTFLPAVTLNLVSSDISGSSILLFTDDAKLTAFINLVKLTSEQQAQFDEWKTANGISVSHEILDLGNFVSTEIKPF